MQWIPNDENKRRDEAFAEFIGGVAYEEDRGWSKEVWDAAWSAKREWVGMADENVRELWSWSASAEAERTANTQQHAFARALEAKLREKNT